MNNGSEFPKDFITLGTWWLIHIKWSVLPKYKIILFPLTSSGVYADSFGFIYLLEISISEIFATTPIRVSGMFFVREILTLLDYVVLKSLKKITIME